MVGAQNVIQSLKTLDPAMMVVENGNGIGPESYAQR